MEKPTVLVVDDDREIARAIGKLLEMEDCKVMKAYNGMEALDIVSTQSIQLIILDIMMPKLDGLSATMKIRQSKNIPTKERNPIPRHSFPAWSVWRWIPT